MPDPLPDPPLDVLLARLQDVPDDPVDLQEWIEKRSITLVCPDCGNSWRWHSPRGTPFEKLVAAKLPDHRCPDCYQKNPVRADLPRHIYLQKAGVPVLFRRQQFVEPPRWPRDERPGMNLESVDPGQWQGRPWCVGFMGVTRTGKTSMAVEMLWRNRKRAGGPFFIRVDRMVSILFGADGQATKEHVYRQANEAPIALLDDLGWGALGRGFELVQEIIANRHGSELPTLWTGNHEYKDLVAKLPPMMSRLETGLLIKLSPRDAWGVNGEPPQGFKQLSISPEGSGSE